MSLVGVLAVSICFKAVWEKFHISYWNVLGYHDAISMFSACFSGAKNIQQELEIENIVIFESDKKEEAFGCIEIHCASLHCVMIVRPHAVSTLNVPACL